MQALVNGSHGHTLECAYRFVRWVGEGKEDVEKDCSNLDSGKWSSLGFKIDWNTTL